jgi:esterase/lipase superfamily enzyme
MRRISFVIYYFSTTLTITFISLQVNTVTSFAQGIKSTFVHPVYLEPDIFVISNRQTDTLNAKFQFTNNVNTDPSLTFFRVNASSMDSLRLTKLDSIAFLTEILDVKEQNWLLFIHGDSQTFEQATIRGLNIQNKYNIRVIVFCWPSKEPNVSGIKNFKNSFQNVEKSINHFYSVLNTMSGLRNSKTDFLIENKLSLLLHSLGNYYLECMVNKNMLSESPSILFDNVIINAAAVEQKNHKEWIEQLNFQKNIFIINNKQDFNLNGLRIFTKRGKQLGEKVKFPLANNAVYFNFTKSVGFRIPTGTSHTYFIGQVPERNEKIGLFYFEILHGLYPNLADETRFVNRQESSGDILVR